uniref:SNF2-related protein n=1 Tax=Mariniphaga sediminis TaxID=1628158 RepID=UPI0035659E3F
PGNVKIHWQREWMKFSNRKALILNDDIRNSWPFYIKQKLADVFIVNFESLMKYFVFGIRTPKGRPMQYRDIVFNPAIDYFETIIVDESQRVKDWGAQQTKFVTGIADGIAEKKEFKIELTGTPILNHYGDWIPQLRIMDRLNDFGGDRYFRNRYCAGPNKASNGRELRAKLWQTCFFRRTKAETKKDSPPVTRQIITCEISNRREYEFAKKDLTSYLQKYKNENDDKAKKQMKKVAWQKMNVLTQVSAKGKVKALVEHIRDFQTTGKKQLIYAEHHDVVDRLKKAFPKAVCVTGREDENEKQRAIDAFSQNKRVTLAIISAAAGTGTDGLQNQCSDIELLEHPWHDPGIVQIESRLDRIPQAEGVNSRIWQGENTVDQHKWKVVEIKKKLSDTVMSNDDTQEQENIADMAIDMMLEEMG